jgi:transcriptional regulator with XRE-family HTH domain
MSREAAFYAALGAAIRDGRARIGWTQIRLAVELGFRSSVAVNHWEHGRTRPSAYTLHRLDSIFGEGWRP